MEHRRAALTVAGRRLLVERIRFGGWPVTRAAEAQGVSRATAHKWLGRYDTEGWAGLAGRSSRPHRIPHRISPEREAAIIAHRQATLEGPHRIGWALGESRSTVWRVLRRNGLPRLADLDRATRTVVRYQRDRPGELVHVDVKKQGRIPDGGGWRIHGRGKVASGTHLRARGKQPRLGFDYLHIAVDDRTRIAYLEAHRDERKETATGFIARAIDHFAQLGIGVERVMTDNGSCYRSRLFRDQLADRGVRHLRTRPYRPQTNGKVERFNLTLKNEWAYVQPYTSNQQRLDALDGWLHHYNHHRPHTAHDGQAPMSHVDNLVRNHS
ncbi:IS481 family transposase [Salsipaludibacter albus]|uniref:IS481 family transposase n=1 Tax=Salsipaludibacter albus TaxID=2849650 RepID=UPI001EE4B682|nr:IS481 family transposase [Salsipaludibacter albus]